MNRFTLMLAAGFAAVVAASEAPAQPALVLPPATSLGGSSVVSSRGGGFVVRQTGTDDQGQPVLGTVYQAGSRQRSAWRRSARDNWSWSGGLRYHSGSTGFWRFSDAGYCYPAVLRFHGYAAWPLVVNPGFGGGLTILVSF